MKYKIKLSELCFLTWQLLFHWYQTTAMLHIAWLYPVLPFSTSYSPDISSVAPRGWSWPLVLLRSARVDKLGIQAWESLGVRAMLLQWHWHVLLAQYIRLLSLPVLTSISLLWKLWCQTHFLLDKICALCKTLLGTEVLWKNSSFVFVHDELASINMVIISCTPCCTPLLKISPLCLYVAPDLQWRCSFCHIKHWWMWISTNTTSVSFIHPSSYQTIKPHWIRAVSLAHRRS